jgi:hypothetical protein
VSDTEAPTAPTSFTVSRGATALIVAILAGFAGVVLFSLLDHPKAATLETFSQTSAVGDTHHFEIPLTQLAVPDPVLKWQGRAWAPANYDKLKIHDPMMVRVGEDPESGYRVYRELGKPDDSPVYLKVDVSEYLKLEPR